jgi:hypothetical protein
MRTSGMREIDFNIYDIRGKHFKSTKEWTKYIEENKVQCIYHSINYDGLVYAGFRVLIYEEKDFLHNLELEC